MSSLIFSMFRRSRLAGARLAAVVLPNSVSASTSRDCAAEPGVGRGPRPERLLATASIVAALVTGVAFAAYAASVSLDEQFSGVTLNHPDRWNASATGQDICLTAREKDDANKIALGSGSLNGCADPAIDTDGQGVLRLTGAINNQAATFLYNETLPLADGLDITFSLAMYGGNGADGISFFLKDGANTDDRPGVPGAGLGYSLLRTDGTTRGVRGALVGIGFDVFGNFASPDVAKDCDSGTGSGSVNPGTQAPNRVIVRGPDLSAAQDGSCGYFHLGEAPHHFGNDPGNATNRGEGARDVRIIVDKPSVADPKIKVYIGPAGALLEGVPTVEVDQPAVFRTTPTFKFGFSASTGGTRNNHEVWALGIGAAVPVTSVAARPPSLALACSPQDPPVGATVICEVTGGDPGIDILWNASVGGVGFAGQGVTLDGRGTASFTFIASVPGEVQVDLVDWGVTDVVVAAGPVPASVPAGDGGPPVGWLLALGLLAASVLMVRRPVEY